ncbi:MAG: hypothetical protein JOZ41_09575 [Chloroflexi bacterium]|nr:hypothetical protein [Chloroflexota bacterium]
MSTQRRADSYQEMLRKVGAWLDAAAARCVTVREESDGFIVQYEHQEVDLIFLQRFFSYRQLSTRSDANVRVRRTLVRRIGHKLQGLSAEPGGYQDLFRALGHRLDAESARHVEVREDEMEGALVVTYRPAGGEDGSATDRSEIVLNGAEREALRRDARARRGGWERHE